ncbi:hypothetical protein AAHA92_16790 [Salvia divinorum]|uniref:Ubiquitin-like protease family profile domain-containing protein n=1 Tax=Salvia divinorum TaxID=28513 RepID=A0ABD1H0Q0_SALDI
MVLFYVDREESHPKNYSPRSEARAQGSDRVSKKKKRIDDVDQEKAKTNKGNIHGKTFDVPSNIDVDKNTAQKGNVTSSVTNKKNVTSSVPSKANVTSDVPSKDNLSSDVPSKDNVASDMPDNTNLDKETVIINKIIQQIDEEDSISCSAVEALIGAGEGCLDLTPGELEKYGGSDKGKDKAGEATNKEPTINSECLTTNVMIMDAIPISEIPMREIRSRESKRLSSALCSPFNQRIVKVGPKLTSEDKDLYYYILDTEKIDKAPTSPTQHFMTTFSCVYNVVNRAKDWNESKAKYNFIAHIESQVQKITRFDITKYDLVFFPICSHEHYYLVCFGMKTGTLDIIDSTLLVEGQPELLKYGNDLELLKKFFMAYLNKKKLKENKSKALEYFMQNKGKKAELDNVFADLVAKK